MTILHIDSSINGDNSASRQLTKSIVGQLRTAQWGEEIVYRDLAASPQIGFCSDWPSSVSS